jgi:glycerophosphoryl diester phosphodiesterase
MIPMLHHDTNLQRMAGVDFDIRELEAKQLKEYKASYPERFGQEFADNKFAKFKKFCKWLAKHPDVQVFVELKQESIDRFGLHNFVDKVYHRLVGVQSQCIIISFNQQVVEYARKISNIRVGWVLPQWNEANRIIAEQLKPDFLFCSKNILPDNDTDIWQGPWQWAVYNLDDIESAIAMAERGFDYLETNEIGTLMQNEFLANHD